MTGAPYGVACRRPNQQHRSKIHDTCTQPLLLGDYAFVRNTGGDHLTPILVARLKPRPLHDLRVSNEGRARLGRSKTCQNYA